MKDYRTVKRRVFGPILLEMLKNSTDDYVVMYTRYTTILEIYEHENYDRAEQDWNTLDNAFRHMLLTIKDSFPEWLMLTR